VQFPVESVREVARLLESANLGEVSLESSGARLSLKRNSVSYVSVPSQEVDENEESVVEDVSEAVTDSSETQNFVVVSNWVGVFRAPKVPVAEGSNVKKKQALGVIESLKVPFEVYAPENGTVAAILVEEGQGIEWGQPLFEITPEK
jgi:acetyl-CoA carboxylase biotin carboxyl carrier protein